jgi:hypothetical protein
MEVIQKIHSIQEIQDAIKAQIEQNVFFKRASIPVIPENAAQIEFLIKNAIGKLGIVCVVQTPTFEFYGKDEEGHPVWTMPEATIVISEIPTVNRARAGAGTALDAALQAAEALNELGSGIVLKSIYQMENQGVVSVFVTFETSAHFCYDRKDLV